MSPEKDKLREQIKLARTGLTQEEIEQKSLTIINQLYKNLDWAQIKLLHAFLPLSNLNEVNTRALFSYIWNNYPAVACYSNRKIQNSWTDVKLGPNFIEGKPILNLPKFDVIIVPTLGFDSRLHRLGYGKGYYDRFLVNQPQAKKIGLCFELGKIDKLPIEDHDIPLDMVITEERVYLTI